MQQRKFIFWVLIMFMAALAAFGCTLEADPCQFVSYSSLTVYRLPDTGSDIFGTLPSGATHEVLAYTADGWLGFDPGVAQAGNIGLAHHRWVQLNAIIDPACLVSVDLVTLADVEADLAASGGP
jgi:hypothetical protein